MKNGSFILDRQLKSEQLNAKIMNYPIATLPERKITQNTSPIGIDRAILFDDKGYNNRQIDLIVGFEGDKADDNISKFMSTLDVGKYVDLVMYSDPNFAYQVVRTASATKARPSYSASYRELTISLDVAPYKYIYPADTIDIASGKDVTIVNPTNYESKPVFHITVKGDADLTVNGKKLSMHDIQNDIYIDSSIQDAYHAEGSTYVNDNALLSVGGYPILKTGNNTINLSAGTATLEGRWRSI